MSTNVVAFVLIMSSIALVFVGWSIWRLASASKSHDVDLLYALTHDMSIPLQEILATLANMKAYMPHNELQLKQDIDSIYQATSYLTELTANFKSLSLLDSPDGMEQSRLVDLAGIAQRVIIRLGSNAERAHVRLTYQGSDTAPKIWGNESDLERMLYNLIHNGIKYRDEAVAQSEVVITLSRDSNGSDMLLLEVEDNGIGMSAHRVATVGDRPFQPRSAQTIGIHGTGFGLYLVKRIIDKYNGQIEVDSQTGRGTRFSIRFPIAKQEI